LVAKHAKANKFWSQIMSLEATELAAARTDKPARRPQRPYFSSGPTAKRPDWSAQAIASAPLGRSNRSSITVARLQLALQLTRDLLKVPENFKVFMVPGSDTGAFEAAMWNLLGPRKVQVMAFESFGQLWADDANKHLKLGAEILSAPYGRLPDLTRIDKNADLVFPWNGTTSGVRMPNADFIAADHQGLIMCDATSAAFCMAMPLEKFDVTTFSFQKALGGEAGLGIIILSPKAVERLDSFIPDRALPKVIRLTKDGKSDTTILDGDAINTYSFMVIEDYIDALRWGLREGGVEGLTQRCDRNFSFLEAWVEATPWIDFVAEDKATRSTTSVCLKFVDPEITTKGKEAQSALARKIGRLLEAQEVAFDIVGYRLAPPGLRIWCGCTVDADDVCALLPWLDWAYGHAVLGV
jgi:phosphoserine aminotransferase